MTKAKSPGEITQILLDCLKSGDLNGIDYVYEEDALLMTGEGNSPARGRTAIKKVYAEMLKQHPSFEGSEIRKPIVHGEIALTSSVLADGRVTAEVARKQPDGTWMWYLDQPGFVLPK